MSDPTQSPEGVAARLIELETSLLDPDVRRSERVRELLADDFLEVSSSGRTFGKEDVVAALRAESPAARSTAEFVVRFLTPQTALVTYRVWRRAEPSARSLRSSIWQERDGQWQLVFHQGTVVAADPVGSEASPGVRPGGQAASRSGSLEAAGPSAAALPRGADKDVARFGRWAASYDRSRLQRIVFAPLHEVTLNEAAAAMPRPRSVLDIGCGTGLFLKMAARRFPTADLTGVDAAGEMVAAARAAALAGMPVHFLQAFAERLPFPDAAFDLVVTTMSFHHWADQEAALHEVNRVLAPGGLFALTDALRVGWFMLVFARNGRFNKPAALQRMLAAAGFAEIRKVPAPRFGGTVQVVLARRPGPRAA